LDYLGRKQRYVIYNGEAEPSKIPPTFHAWLHYLTNEIPPSDSCEFSWQKDHIPNLTGTESAYNPMGKRHKRSKVSADYQPFQPSKLLL
jgi:NADH:ubiquinone oxidoreductase subunit